ncbi:RNA polymerase sigma factor [Shewanella sp. Scap07]|uniref:RNA polymerase sigma factor n=1 Tax=Shewanella sp. Scap07 TaxID=2589987 RepID=UPI0015B9B99B|nr:RNA polymerase sigma factor [Shewanella sp. Scap07]QLE83792.1 RNA polymerase sigma factor [Shewanella sp. Scap07]
MFDASLLNSLYRYCFCLTLDKSRAEDLLQTVLEKWLRRADSGNYQPSYVRKMIRNQYIDDCRHQQCVAFDSIEQHAPVLLDEHNLEQLTIAQDLIEKVIVQLSISEREVLYLWAVVGFTANEIATELAQPRGTILSRLHRIKSKVAQWSDEPDHIGRGVS